MLGGEVTVRASDVAARAGEAPESQTTSAKNVEIGVLWARWSVFGHNGAWPRVQLAHEPANASANPRYRTSTLYLECGRGCPGVN